MKNKTLQTCCAGSYNKNTAFHKVVLSKLLWSRKTRTNNYREEILANHTIVMVLPCCKGEFTIFTNINIKLIYHGAKAGQGTCKCGLPAEFIDVDRMSVQELMALQGMPHTPLDGDHHNR